MTDELASTRQGVLDGLAIAHKGRQPSESELDAHCLARIARFKRPKAYVFRQDLPKSSYGKVLKRELMAPAAPFPAKTD